MIKVLDFGLAKVKSEGAVDGGLTHEGQMLGTPDYIAPEQISDARRADIRADIYSLGCTLYYLLTGGPPFKATSLYEILQAHHSMDALPLNLARPEVPVELAALVARMMAKEPERRFQTPGEVAQALTPFFRKGGDALRASNPEVSRTRVARDAQRTFEPRPVAPDPAKIIEAATASSKFPPEGRLAPARFWKSLVETGQSGLEGDFVRSVATSRPHRWVWPAVTAGVLAIGFVIGQSISFEPGKSESPGDARETPAPVGAKPSPNVTVEISARTRAIHERASNARSHAL